MKATRVVILDRLNCLNQLFRVNRFVKELLHRQKIARSVGSILLVWVEEKFRSGVERGDDDDWDIAD